MSATLAFSVAWDTRHARATATTPINGQHYRISREWGTALVQCLNSRLAQFRVIEHSPAPGFEDLTGWLVHLNADLQASLRACPAPL
jgi:hypothetical protein